MHFIGVKIMSDFEIPFIFILVPSKLKVKFDLSYVNYVDKFGFVFCISFFLETDFVLVHCYFKYPHFTMYFFTALLKNKGEKEEQV